LTAGASGRVRRFVIQIVVVISRTVFAVVIVVIGEGLIGDDEGEQVAQVVGPAGFLAFVVDLDEADALDVA
jgi:hypothetical protein